MSNVKTGSSLRADTRRISTVHFLYVFAFAVQLIAFDAGRLITPHVVLRRWIAIALLLVVTIVVWYVARNQSSQPTTLKRLVTSLVLADIGMAVFQVYTQRGMASRAVMLFAIPIIVSCVLARRSALLATAALCIAAYVTTCVAYFVLNFNEGYKIELYGEVGFYCAAFVILALLLWVFIRPKR